MYAWLDSIPGPRACGIAYMAIFSHQAMLTDIDYSLITLYTATIEIILLKYGNHCDIKACYFCTVSICHHFQVHVCMGCMPWRRSNTVLKKLLIYRRQSVQFTCIVCKRALRRVH